MANLYKNKLTEAGRTLREGDPNNAQFLGRKVHWRGPGTPRRKKHNPWAGSCCEFLTEHGIRLMFDDFSNPSSNAVLTGKAIAPMEQAEP